ncbi:hypothetical protein GQ53DRAFT_771408 [Thozetella sp. PMI_491]|nr:hypothetical protein GQ53DRAFT_771408 [Thozetella sp. PMI_491]
MSKPKPPSADSISAAEFQQYLDRYPACIAAISDSKGARDGQKTLAELDEYRYGKAISELSGKDSKPIELEDVKTLVEWKLRHGKFRPTLMKLVSSNEAGFVKSTVQEAAESYRNDANTPAALDILTRLKGIGPATASLLLAVIDPEKAIFFADEAFYWLCCDSKKDAIKYNGKEYKALSERTAVLAKRLRVKAVDIERVAFVIIREQDGFPSSTVASRQPKSTSSKQEAKKVASKEAKAEPKAEKKQLGKRKTSGSEDIEAKEGPRRSKRGKAN